MVGNLKSFNAITIEMTTVLRIEDVSKMYRLGTVGTGTLSHDLNRLWARVRGLPDPTLKIGATNDRTQSGGQHVWALKDINFEVEQGEILGIIGRNGAGKSTLLKLLSRVTAPTTGSIKARGRIASLLEVGTGFHPELTGRENVFLNGAIMGMTKSEVASRLDEIVEFSGCAKYLDTPVKRYSSGMTVRLGFSVAAHLDCEILIVDEVLAVGDAEFQKKCINKMKDVGNTGKTIVFVSHNMASVQQLTTRCAVISHGSISYEGSPKEAISQYISSNLNILDESASLDDVPRQFGLGEAVRFKTLRVPVGKLIPEFLADESLKFLLVVDAESDHSDLCLGLSILDWSSQPIASGFSAPMDYAAGQNEIEISPNGLRLAAGTYHLSLSLFKGSGSSSRQNLDVVTNAAQFQVLEVANQDSGLLNWNSKYFGSIVIDELNVAHNGND